MAWNAALNQVISPKFVGAAREASRLPFLANTMWEDEANNADQVTIVSIGNITIRQYNGADIIIDDGDASNLVLKVDQFDYFTSKIRDDVKLVGTFADQLAAKGGKKLGLQADKYVLAQTLKANMATGNWIENTTTAGTARSFTKSTAIDIFDEIQEAMNTQSLPEDGRFICLPPSLYTIAKKGARDTVKNSDDILFKGRAEIINGMNVIMSNQYTPVTGKEFKVLWGHADGMAVAAKDPLVESGRMEKQPADLLKVWFRYGAKIVDNTLVGGAHLVAG